MSTARISRADARTANLLGAFALTLHDAMTAAVGSVHGRGGAASAALVLLRDEPGMSVTALGEAIGLSQPGAARLVDALEADALIARGAGADGRTHALRLTTLGERQVARILAARAEVLDAALSRLGGDERRQLGALLDRLLGAWTRDARHGIEVCRLCDTTACPLERCPVEEASLTS